MTRPASLHIAADVKNLAEVRRFVQDTAAAAGAGQPAVDDMVLAVNEVATNIIVHGYQGQPGMIEVEVKVEHNALIVQLRDAAPPFDPTLVPTPDLNQPLSRRRLGGMGIHLTRRLTDRMSYLLRPQGGNELTLIKQLS